MRARCNLNPLSRPLLPRRALSPIPFHHQHHHLRICKSRRTISTWKSGPSYHSHQPQSPLPGSQAAASFSTADRVAGDAGVMGPLEGLMERLDRVAPRFEMEEGGVRVLRGPGEFYAVLKEKILAARRRIYLSTLYIGKTEHELIETIATALRNNPSLKISFLADALRGTRETPEPSCASLLAPLIKEFGPERVQIRLYHTPNLTGLRKKLIPRRINEGWGLQHMKLYGIDDEIILSGANLSNDYFTNRLDRYHLFSSAELTAYFSKIHDAVSSISFDIQPSDSNLEGYSMTWPANDCPSPLDDPKKYVSYASALLGPLILPTSQDDSSATKSTASTFVYPIFQLTPFFRNSERSQDLPTSRDPPQSTEFPVLMLLLESLKSIPFRNSKITFTAGYFNPSKTLVSQLLATEPASLNVITAAPEANGFYNSKGVSGLLPPAYTLLCRRFLEAVEARGEPLASRARLFEWRRGTVGEEGGWTYHAKGIWVTLPQTQHSDKQDHEKGPSITVVGSSNYTKRSYTLDLEANALVVTRDEQLQERLAEEEEWLKEDAHPMTPNDYQRTERRVGLHVRIAMWITTLVGGAL